jgi:hypothetical protein
MQVELQSRAFKLGAIYYCKQTREKTEYSPLRQAIKIGKIFKYNLTIHLASIAHSKVKLF